MSNLLDLHEQMLGTYEKTAEANGELEILEKYAAFADQALDEYTSLEGAEFDDYDEEDVVKLAELLIENDLQMEEEMQKVAELDEAGRVMARAFMDELGYE